MFQIYTLCSADFESPAPYTDTAQSKPRRSSQSSTAKSAEWVPSQDPGLALRTAPRTHHEVQQQVGIIEKIKKRLKQLASRQQTLTPATTLANHRPPHLVAPPSARRNRPSSR